MERSCPGQPEQGDGQRMVPLCASRGCATWWSWCDGGGCEPGSDSAQRCQWLPAFDACLSIWLKSPEAGCLHCARCCGIFEGFCAYLTVAWHVRMALFHWNRWSAAGRHQHVHHEQKTVACTDMWLIDAWFSTPLSPHAGSCICTMPTSSDGWDCCQVAWLNIICQGDHCKCCDGTRQILWALTNLLLSGDHLHDFRMEHRSLPASGKHAAVGQYYSIPLDTVSRGLASIDPSCSLVNRSGADFWPIDIFRPRRNWWPKRRIYKKWKPNIPTQIQHSEVTSTFVEKVGADELLPSLNSVIGMTSGHENLLI